jgi:hypothetical protein
MTATLNRSWPLHTLQHAERPSKDGATFCLAFGSSSSSSSGDAAGSGEGSDGTPLLTWEAQTPLICKVSYKEHICTDHYCSCGALQLDCASEHTCMYVYVLCMQCTTSCMRKVMLQPAQWSHYSFITAQGLCQAVFDA